MKKELRKFLRTNGRYDIGFTNTNVIEYGNFDNASLADAIAANADPMSANTDINDSDLSVITVTYTIYDSKNHKYILKTTDKDIFYDKIKELAAVHSQTAPMLSLIR